MQLINRIQVLEINMSNLVGLPKRKFKPYRFLFIYLFTQSATQNKHKTDNMKNTKAEADHRDELQLRGYK